MHRLATFTILLTSIAMVYTDCDNESDKSGYSDSWKPIPSVYEDRVKPAKVTPKYDDKYIHNAVGKPYGTPPYIQGIYTFPYYAYGEIKPVYQPLYNPYPPYYNGDFYIKKEDKNKPYVPYYKN
ncbi:unnamed protein product [Spodoptera exigua]|nr:unnamed protein product [Spodoptera exigua]